MINQPWCSSKQFRNRSAIPHSNSSIKFMMLYFADSTDSNNFCFTGKSVKSPSTFFLLLQGSPLSCHFRMRTSICPQETFQLQANGFLNLTGYFPTAFTNNHCFKYSFLIFKTHTKHSWCTLSTRSERLYWFKPEYIVNFFQEVFLH